MGQQAYEAASKPFKRLVDCGGPLSDPASFGTSRLSDNSSIDRPVLTVLPNAPALSSSLPTPMVPIVILSSTDSRALLDIAKPKGAFAALQKDLTLPVKRKKPVAALPTS